MTNADEQFHRPKAIDEDARIALAAHKEIDNSGRYNHIEGFIWALCLDTQSLFPVTQTGKQPSKEIL